MRLIDAEDFGRVIREYCKDCIEHNKQKMDIVDINADIQDFLDNQPTAFDVEKVVEQLDNLRKEYKMEANNINIPHNYSCYYKGHMRGYEHSIDIVMRGGLDE